jgi:hypothetical protein
MQPAENEPPTQSVANSSTLTRVTLDDIFKDFNGSRRWMRHILEPLARPSTHRFAQVMAHLDQIVARSGFRDGMRYGTSVFATSTKQLGCEHVPDKGPLLLVANHPGGCDAMAIAASLPRDDLKIIVSGFPLFRNLPNASRQLIFTDPHGGLGSNFPVIRSAIRHLQSGGSVLTFPSGRVEPDPSIMPRAMELLQNWSPSIELLVRKVPHLKIQFAIVSGVLSPIFLYNPFTNLMRGLRDPQAIAETLQVITQMLFTRWVRIRPVISFGIPKTVDELRRNDENLFQSVITEAGRLLADHMQLIA